MSLSACGWVGGCRIRGICRRETPVFESRSCVVFDSLSLVSLTRIDLLDWDTVGELQGRTRTPWMMRPSVGMVAYLAPCREDMDWGKGGFLVVYEVWVWELRRGSYLRS